MSKWTLTRAEIVHDDDEINSPMWQHVRCVIVLWTIRERKEAICYTNLVNVVMGVEDNLFIYLTIVRKMWSVSFDARANKLSWLFIVV